MPHPRDVRRGNGWAGLLDQYVLRGLKRRDLFVLIWFGLISALIWGDNNQGKLADWPGLRWTLLKCLIVSGYFLVLAALIKAAQVLPGWVRSMWRGWW